MRLDQDIEQRVNAYRGNPQALQQRYAANQELLDLLALQRLKSEKDEAARQVQIEMQENPQTIKQQRERQLVEMTKQDLVNQTAGILQNRRSRQQKNLQRVARQGAAGPRQMQSGLGALAQRQRQPQRPQQVAMRQPQRPQQAPMRRMMKAAEGGIVAFAEGDIVNGEITQAEIDEYRRSLGGQNPRAMRLSDDQIRAIIERERAPKPAMTSTRRGLRQASATLPIGQTNTISDAENAAIDQEILAQRNAVELGKEAGRTEVIPLSATGKQSNNGAQSTSNDIMEPDGIMALYNEQDKLTAPKIDISQAGSGAAQLLADAGIDTSTTPEAAGIKAQTDALDLFGRDTKRGKIDAYLQELKNMDARQQDPDKLRRERTSAFLRGTAGTGSFGQTMAAGSAAMASERQSQEKSERERILKRIGIDQIAMTMDADIVKQALTDGRYARESAIKNRQLTAQVMQGMRRDDINVAINTATLDFQANKNNIANLLQAANIQYTNDLRKALESADRRNEASNILAKIGKDKLDFLESYLLDDPRVKQATMMLDTYEGDDEKRIADLKKLLNTARKEASIRAEQMINLAGINETMAILEQIIEGKTNVTIPTRATSATGDYVGNQSGYVIASPNEQAVINRNTSQ